MKLKEVIELIEEYKVPLGLGEWEFTFPGVSNTLFCHDLGKNFAEIEYDKFECKATIKFSKDMKKKSHADKINVIVHELIHMKLGLHGEYIGELLENLEERLVNDITRLICYVKEGKE